MSDSHESCLGLLSRKIDHAVCEPLFLGPALCEYDELIDMSRSFVVFP